MEIIPTPFNGENYWKKKGYVLLNGAKAPRRKIKVVKVAAGKDERKRKRFWRIRKAPKVVRTIMSPKKLWSKLRESYVRFMLKIAGGVHGGNEFMAKRISGGRKVRRRPAKHDVIDFECRIVLEIYKSLATSRGVSEF